MKKVLFFFLLSVLVLLPSCGKKAPKNSPDTAKFLLIDEKGAEYFSERPSVSETALLFVRVNPGTIISGGSHANHDTFFILEKPISGAQAATHLGLKTEGHTPLVNFSLKDFLTGLEKLKKSTKLALALPKAENWDFAFLSGAIPENDQPLVWEWVMDGEKEAWRGRVWHVMELTKETDETRDPAAQAQNLGFRLVLPLPER